MKLINYIIIAIIVLLCAGGFVVSWDGSELYNAYVYNNLTCNGTVGIGTSTPAQLIHMVGNGSSSTGWARFGTSTSEYTEIGHKGSNGAINTVGDGNLDFRHDGTTLMNLTDTGNVSIVGNITIMGGLTCLNAGCSWNMTGNCMYYPNGAKAGTDC